MSGTWALTPEMFNEVQSIYSRHIRNESVDIGALEAKLGPLKNSPIPPQTRQGVAIISLEGVLAKRANLFMQISGGTSTQMASQQFAKALADPTITGIVLAIDSPGGTVDGTQALADQIYAARGKKPIIAACDGICASAAYWIASAADKVVIANDTTMVGSIGVITTHLDQSARDMQAGVRVTEIKAGKYKQIGSSNAPLGMAEKDALQSMVDANYAVFLEAVARNRGVDVETVQQDMAEGRVFLGKAAIDAGLVDGVATLDQVIAEVAEDESAESPDEDKREPFEAAGAGVALTAVETQKPTEHVMADEKLTAEQIKAKYPDAARALVNEGLTASQNAVAADAQVMATVHQNVKKAVVYQRQQAALGIEVSDIEALSHVAAAG
jgi:signal peptide peptidase SppA